MIERGEILTRMKSIENYLQDCSTNDILFKPELDCAKAIWQIVENSVQLTAENAEEIIRIFNHTNATPHYNGSGWIDYRLHLQRLLTVDNFNIEYVNGYMAISN
jgi:hypothetical protein